MFWRVGLVQNVDHAALGMPRKVRMACWLCSRVGLGSFGDILSVVD